MANSLYPSFVEILSHSVYGPHVMTIPTLQWNSGGAAGDFETWDSVGVAADVMVENFIDIIAPFYPASYTFDGYTIYTMDTPTSPAIPRVQTALAVVGTNGTPGNTKAVQATWTWKTTLGGIFKVVNLDMGNNNSFERVTLSGLGAAGLALVAEVQSDGNGWAGRDGGQPTFFLQVSYTMNEKLRRAYRMT